MFSSGYLSEAFLWHKKQYQVHQTKSPSKNCRWFASCHPKNPRLDHPSWFRVEIPGPQNDGHHPIEPNGSTLEFHRWNSPLSFHAWRINGNHNLPTWWDALDPRIEDFFHVDFWMAEIYWDLNHHKKYINGKNPNLFQLDVFSSKAITMKKLMKTARHLEDGSSLNSSTSWQCPLKANKQLPYPDAQGMAYLPTKLSSFRVFHPR